MLSPHLRNSIFWKSSSPPHHCFLHQVPCLLVNIHLDCNPDQEHCIRTFSEWAACRVNLSACSLSEVVAGHGVSQTEPVCTQRCVHVLVGLHAIKVGPFGFRQTRCSFRIESGSRLNDHISSALSSNGSAAPFPQGRSFPKASGQPDPHSQPIHLHPETHSHLRNIYIGHGKLTWNLTCPPTPGTKY